MEQNGTGQTEHSAVELNRRQVLKGMGLLGSALAVGNMAGVTRAFAEMGKDEGRSVIGPYGRLGAGSNTIALTIGRDSGAGWSCVE